ncbi:SIS domain-containing protein [Candidatus Nitrosotenuis cloacae]|uniref:SIS domain-containing protein n=1 Tax=Candidatus Nitrosotenuis cloacae TaxID=1603555 RepID=UPI002A4E2698|nr:SIS domain-containing protein [Candidatus Nitrosotenuis cloacae]
MNKFDSYGMYKVYDRWPEIAKESYNTDLAQINFEKISHIVLTGMGGSGTINDIFSSILSKTNIHVDVVKGYHIPNTINANTLVVTTSVSGNTAESLTVLNSAKNTGSKIIAFSSGGKMEEYCKANKIEHRHISTYHSPRASLTSFLFAMLKILQPIITIKKTDVVESIENLEYIQEKISSANLTSENSALSLADWISNIPVIYYPWGLQAAAIRFKNSLQENAKMHAMAEDIIEACHNGIVAWQRQSDLKPILIRGEDDYVKTKERWTIIKEYFEQNKIEYKEISSANGSILSKIIGLIYLLDYSTIYRAVISGIDPTPVNAINFVKSRSK